LRERESERVIVPCLLPSLEVVAFINLPFRNQTLSPCYPSKPAGVNLVKLFGVILHAPFCKLDHFFNVTIICLCCEKVQLRQRMCWLFLRCCSRLTSASLKRCLRRLENNLYNNELRFSYQNLFLRNILYSL
jgi:hypothetical protein